MAVQSYADQTRRTFDRDEVRRRLAEKRIDLQQMSVLGGGSSTRKSETQTFRVSKTEEEIVNVQLQASNQDKSEFFREAALKRSISNALAVSIKKMIDNGTVSEDAVEELKATFKDLQQEVDLETYLRNEETWIGGN
jgi:ribosomal protein S8E